VALDVMNQPVHGLQSSFALPNMKMTTFTLVAAVMAMAMSMPAAVAQDSYGEPGWTFDAATYYETIISPLHDCKGWNEDIYYGAQYGCYLGACYSYAWPEAPDCYDSETDSYGWCFRVWDGEAVECTADYDCCPSWFCGAIEVPGVLSSTKCFYD
jgi:hypothetical protein